MHNILAIYIFISFPYYLSIHPYLDRRKNWKVVCGKQFKKWVHDLDDFILGVVCLAVLHAVYVCYSMTNAAWRK